MSFKDLQIDDEYRSDEYSDIGKSFISNVLTESVIYNRAVGFFSSSALLNISKGLSKLICRDNCHISLIASPYLSKEDVDAIKLGYENREKIIENSLLNSFKEPTDEFDKERLNFLCHLIEENILDIKIANKKESNSEMGMFHEKIGVFIDQDGNKIAFSGSLNESDNAFNNNFESIQVFTSWDEPKRVLKLEDNFNRLWNNETNTLEIYDFPSALKDKLFKYRKDEYHRNIDEYIDRKLEEKRQKDKLPRYGLPFDLYDYQKKAINKWANNGFRGIFDMGTGTGKTITALTASVKLLERMKYRMATIIVCPYTHLVEQWVEEKENFNIDFIVGYSNNKYKNYLSVLENTIQDFNDGLVNNFYFITTNASYRTSKVQNLLKKIMGPVLFIADEVHNFGAEKLASSLIDKFNFRIGLSATVDRHRDEEGTQAIYNYFGEKCISYGLKEAIQNNVLTRYYYYTIPVYLNAEEQEEYIKLTEKIKKNTFKENDTIKLSKAGEFYAIQRARIIATAQNKINKLKEIMEQYKDDKNILVYCGTGKTQSETGEEEKQIDEVCKMLGNELSMKICRYTSRESVEERSDIATRYKNGDIQALVAIKCLDEGVNIPSIKSAFILASSTNPREYIQRRGRVLRKFPGKQYSYIFDFVTLPFPFEEIDDYDENIIGEFKALAKNEIERIKEFSSLAENDYQSAELIQNITDCYGLNEFENNDIYGEIEWGYNDE